jgi:hypothetical protein
MTNERPAQKEIDACRRRNLCGERLFNDGYPERAMLLLQFAELGGVGASQSFPIGNEELGHAAMHCVRGRVSIIRDGCPHA